MVTYRSTHASRSSRWLLCLLVCSLASTPLVRARAEAPACDLAGINGARYRDAIERALQAYRSHRYADARSFFAEAHALCPSARTLRGLGLSALELRQYGECAELLRSALGHPVHALDDSLRSETRVLLAQAERFLAPLTLAVVPSSATLRVDGVLARTPLHGPLELSVGEHLLELSASGYVAQRFPLAVRAREPLALHVELAQLDDPDRERATQQAARRALHELALALRPPSSARATQATHVESPVGHRWLWTGLCAVTAAAALGLGFGLTARGTTTSAAISSLPVATRAGP